VKAPDGLCKQIAFGKTDPPLQIKLRCIFPRELECIIGNVHGVHRSFWELRGKRERDDAAASPNIEDG